MKKTKLIITRNTGELAKALKLSPADIVEMDVRIQINKKIVEAADHSGLTHANIAKAAGTSRTRITAILNQDTTHVSTDLMLRILAALGYRANVTFTRTRRAA